MVGEEYSSALNNHVRAELAYEYDAPLPEGSTIVPPTIEEVRARATVFNADFYFNAMRNARQAAEKVN